MLANLEIISGRYCDFSSIIYFIPFPLVSIRTQFHCMVKSVVAIRSAKTS